MKTTYIYGLFAEKDLIRYVGKSNNLEKRLYEHIINSKFKKTHKDIWIQKELKIGNKIGIVLLEEVSFEDWKEAEIKWIEFYKNNNLTNHAKGGMGGRAEVYNISYDTAKEWVKNNLDCKSKNEWRKITNTDFFPKFIPKQPNQKFKNSGWIGWGDFLGTKRKQDNLKSLDYVSYEEAKKIIKQKFIIKTIKNWHLIAKEDKIPSEIPNRPDRFYKKRGWISWGDFLGTDKIANQNKKFIDYQKMVEWLKQNNIKIKSKKDWLEFCKNKRPQFIPSNPNKTYKGNGWISWNKLEQDV